MNEFVLTCCSTADLPKERFEQLKVSYVCFNYTIDGVTYPDDLGQSIRSMSFTAAWRKAQ